MTKKHFVWAARYVREIADPRHDRMIVEEAFVELFRHFGPNFDEQRFREACKP